MTNKEVYQRCLELVDSAEVITWPHEFGAGIKYVCNRLGVCDLLTYLRPGCKKKDFTEWFEQNPGSTNAPYDYWWPIQDRESRRLALLEAIKLCDNAAVHP